MFVCASFATASTSRWNRAIAAPFAVRRGADDLQRNDSFHEPVFRLVDDAHPAAAHPGQDTVTRVLHQPGREFTIKPSIVC
jgi:hypothetical protein